MVRRSLKTLLVFCVAWLCGCTVHAPPPSTTNLTAVTYEVFGMDCPGCHGGLEKNLKKIPGVADASANWKQQIVTIWLDGEHDVDDGQIEKAIRDSNFTPGQRLN